MSTLASRVLVQRRAAVAWVTVDRPEARNAFTPEMYARLGELCLELEADDGVRVIVLQGQGDEAFVSGSDIATVGKIASREDALAYEARVESAIGRLERLPKPTVALIRGAAVGAGAAFALACDVRIAAENARFGVPIARTVGNTLSLRNIARMVQTVGPAATKELLFTARLYDAAEGLRRGVWSEVVPLDRIEARVSEIAETIAANAPLTLRASKLAVLRVLETQYLAMGSGDDIVELTYTSLDFREGINAFLEKRKPHWKGR